MKYRTGWTDVTVGFEVDKSLSVGLEFIPALMASDKKLKNALWDVSVGGSVDTTPLIADNIAYFGVCDKNFYAVDVETGREIWRFPASGPIRLSNAALHKGILYFGSEDGSLYAVRKEDGRLVWKFPTQGKITASPAIKDGIAYVSSQDKNLYAVSADDGKLAWKFPLDSLSWNMLLYENIIFVPCYSGNLYALTIDKRLLWKFKSSGGYFFPPPAVRDGIVYQSGNDDNFYAIDLATGRLVWKFRGGGSFHSSPAFHGEIVTAGNIDGNVYGLDRKTGRLVWKFRAESMTSWRSLVKDGVVYFGSWDSNFYAVNADNGQLMWKFRTSGPLNSAGSAIVDGRILFGSYDCNLYCLDVKTGSRIWKFPTSIGTPSRIELIPEKQEEITIQSIWKETEEEKRERKEGIEIKDYGGSGNEYASGMSKDYIKGKKGYI